MLSFPNAKINLGLYIESKREDGYHNISTVFYPIPFQDIVEIVESDKLELTVYGNKVDCPMEKNLVVKAYRLLEKEFSLPPVSISLYKRIPDGAGLGGGSSDAASVVKILNSMFDLGLTEGDMAKRIARIGADCPFFIYNKPMVARGIGDKFSEVDLTLKGLHLVLVKPDVYVSTAEAYGGVKPAIPHIQIEEIVSKGIEAWKDILVNDFEKSVFAKHPELPAIKEEMYRQGAVYSAMSGSGSSMFGLFESDIMAENCAKALSGYHFVL